jgi:uncharacterized Rossmann fold enzyme
MDYMEWSPYYGKIRKIFGYSLRKDQTAALILDGLLTGKSIKQGRILKILSNKPVLVVGAGPSLESDLQNMPKKVLTSFVVIAADGAAIPLVEDAGLAPQIIVTDLDGLGLRAVEEKFSRSLLVVHAHGDNIPLLKRIVPSLSSAHGTTQAKPLRNVHNYGGFTDGDRAVFLADAFGARIIALAGMDLRFDGSRFSKLGERSSKVRRKKLKVARQLLGVLAYSSKAKLYNVTANGAPIGGFKPISPEDLVGFSKN